ncbi:hypothetical protein Cgig2_031815 [Carnegiea gigantea]|uniref:DUF2470 domain-containing protein n=1 Tax=Carnegiea gigantea TaxID=171969 RepID=A0A9Q1KP15_9CARY|nr:hypothetical protein Cgig2_031815 [Carnegiea gigantea]
MAMSTAFRSSILPISRFNSIKPHTQILYLSPPFSKPCFLSLRCSLSSSSSSSLSSSMAAAAQTVATGDAADEVNIFQRIQSHQEKAARLPPVEEIRTVLANGVRGMLSTFSQKYDGYPSGSMVDFACDVDGSPILAVSSLAVHTKDLLANPKCSLLMARDPEDRTDLVITLHGDAVSVDFGDFQFLKIQPKAVRYVSGVATAVLGSGEFSGEEYSAATVDPVSQFSKPITVDSAYMLDLDRLGFNVKASYLGKTYKLRIPFPRPAVDRKDVKTLIVEMLQSARSQRRLEEKQQSARKVSVQQLKEDPRIL